MNIDLNERELDLVCVAVERWRNSLPVSSDGSVLDGILYHDLTQLLMKLVNHQFGQFKVGRW